MKPDWFFFVLLLGSVLLSNLDPENKLTENDFCIVLKMLNLARQAKYNLNICLVFSHFSILKQMLATFYQSPAVKILINVLWDTERNSEIEIKGLFFCQFITKLYIDTRGLILVGEEELRLINLAQEKVIQLHTSLISILGLPKTFQFSHQSVTNNLHSHLLFYFQLAADEWQKVQFYLPKVHPQIGEKFYLYYEKRNSNFVALEYINQIFELILNPSTEAVERQENKENEECMLVDHVYSHGNLLFIFHLLEYERHIGQITEIQHMLARDRGKTIYQLDYWDYLPIYYAKLISMTLSPNTSPLKSEKVAQGIKIEGDSLFFNPYDNSKCSQNVITEIRFELARTTSVKGAMSSAIYRDGNDIVLVIYSSRSSKNPMMDANSFLEDLMARLNNGDKISLSQVCQK
jgi:hypothetical protein